jgi:hypothetical protein
MAAAPRDPSPRPHRHHLDEGHPAAAVSPSLLRLGVAQRLAAAGLLVALIWAVVFWAMSR